MYKRILWHSVLLGTVIFLIITSTASVVQAASLCVHPGGAGQCFSSIQAAVDAANDGDLIIIREGKYVEQVKIIDKDLTLAGREDVVVQAPDDMEETLLAVTGVGGRPIIGVASSEVTIQNLIVDGANSAEINPFLQGITFINAGGVIRDNVIRNVGFGEPRLPFDQNGQPLYQGDAVVVVNFSAILRTVNIMDNHIINFNNNGIAVISIADQTNPAVANMSVNVVGNAVIGLGATDVIDQYGILLLSDGYADPQFNATGTIRDNRVRDVVTVDPYSLPGSGIFTTNVYNLRIADNVVENVNVGLDATLSLNVQIVDNVFHGPRVNAARSTGLLLSGRDIQVTENRFKKLDVGIFLHIAHPFFQSAVNAVLDKSRFENVPANVITGPDLSDVAGASDSKTSFTFKWQHYRPVTHP